MAKAKMAVAVTGAQPDAAGQELVLQLAYQERVSTLAHEFWIQRGCPLGTPEVDWLRAEEVLRASGTGGILDQLVAEHARAK